MTAENFIYKIKNLSGFELLHLHLILLGMNQVQIANFMNTKKTTIRQRIHRIREKVQNEL